MLGAICRGIHSLFPRSFCQPSKSMDDKMDYLNNKMKSVIWRASRVEGLIGDELASFRRDMNILIDRDVVYSHFPCCFCQSRKSMDDKMDENEEHLSKLFYRIHSLLEETNGTVEYILENIKIVVNRDVVYAHLIEEIKELKKEVNKQREITHDILNIPKKF